MIKKWAKILPYGLVMYLVKKIGPSQIKFNNEWCVGWRIDKGEWIVWNESNYKAMQERDEKERQYKISRRREKYEKLRREFDPEPEEDDEGY